MRAIARTRLAPLAFAAAILVTGLAAHAHVGASAHRTVTEAGPYCPGGTNWDDILQRCI